MKFQILFLILFFYCYIAVVDALGFLNVFKGKQSVEEAILTRNKQEITDILKWKSCNILLKDRSSLLRLLTIQSPSTLLHDVLSESCVKDEEFIVNAVESALLQDDEPVLDGLLTVFRDVADQFTVNMIGGIFARCAAAKNYKCVETMLDWSYPLTWEGKNIVHMAAEHDDLRLLAYAPQDQIFLLQMDVEYTYPMQRVHSKEIAGALNERWEQETKMQSPSWWAVKSIHYMASYYGIPDKTLSFRVDHVATELQKSADNTNWALNLRINRDSVLKDSYMASWFHGAVRNDNWYTPTLSVRIHFIDEIGADYGGPRLEWLSLLIKAFFQENPQGKAEDYTAPLFQCIDENSGMYAPTMLYSNDVYKFAGSIMALALRDKISLGVRLIPAITRMLVRNTYPYFADSCKYHPEDFAAQHPQVDKGLRNLLGGSAEVIEASELTFESNPELPVTKANVEQYFHDVATFRLYKKYEPAIFALDKGFKKVSKKVPLSQLFTYKELETVFLGNGNSFEWEEFQKHCIINGSEESQAMFWEAVKGLTEEQKLQFFQFITARASLPFEGISGLPDKIKIELDYLDEGRFPVATTCFSKVMFARGMTSAEEMREKLIFAMENGGSAFDLV